MAIQKAIRKAVPSGSNEPDIIIERRILVARVTASFDGEHSMLATAFLELGKYYADNDDEEGIEITFEYGGRSFRTALEPSERFRQLEQDF